MVTITVISITMAMTAYTYTAKAELNIDQMIKKDHDLANAIRGLPENCEQDMTGSGNVALVGKDLKTRSCKE
jgi:hypothetical protein